MLKSRQELEEYISKKCEQIVFNNEICEKIREYMLDKYDIPTGTTMDMIARNLLSNQTEFVLFCLMDGIDYARGTKKKNNFFTELEINQYSKEKLQKDTIKFPIVIKCEQVTDDQWIGVVDVDFFMDLRKSQMISYNANAQRVMKRKIKGENVFFKIIPNKKAISDIRELMQKKQYIPTSITLNIPYNSESQFYYDTKERELVISKLTSFDISDGYHRYLAMCEERDKNPEFNYPMELRIINFEDEKTRQFIYQEDQKTKMSKTNSNAMNTNRYSNLVLDRLNEMPTFDLRGQIGLNEGTINYAVLSDVIEYFYFKEKKNYSQIEVRTARDDIKEKLNALTEFDEKYITTPLEVKELALIFYVFSTEPDLEVACKKIDRAIKSGVCTEIKNSRISKHMINTIEQKIK